MTEQEIINKAIGILETRIKEPEYFFTNVQDVNAYLRLVFSELEYESFRVMFLNSQHGLIQLKEMFRGTVDASAVYPREVVKAVLHFNAAAVILAHNHPSGSCEPSHADKHITQRLKDSLALIDVRVLDHIIVGGKNSYSFTEHGLV